VISLGSNIAWTWYEAMAAFAVDAIALFSVSMVTKPREEEDLRGLVWALKRPEQESDSVVGDEAWFRSPMILGVTALAIAAVLDIIFA
jgi:SSS family solute:Na+ symporter